MTFKYNNKRYQGRIIRLSRFGEVWQVQTIRGRFIACVTISDKASQQQWAKLITSTIDKNGRAKR